MPPFSFSCSATVISSPALPDTPKIENNRARCQSTPNQVHPHSRECSVNASEDSHHSEPLRNVGLSIDTHMNEEREAEADLKFDEDVVAESTLNGTSKHRWKTSGVICCREVHSTQCMNSFKLCSLGYQKLRLVVVVVKL